jgi:hypothetical protein
LAEIAVVELQGVGFIPHTAKPSFLALLKSTPRFHDGILLNVAGSFLYPLR